MFDKQLTAAWRKHLTAQRCSAATIKLRMYYLMRFSHDFGKPLSSANLADLEAWMGAHLWSDNTARSARAALATFFEWATFEGHLESSPARRLAIVPEGPPLPHPCPERIYRAALASADDRVHLMLRISGEAGARRSEVAQVHIRDLMETLYGWDLLIHGKGNKDRLVPVSDDLAREIKRACRAGGGWAFPSPVGDHLTAGHVGVLVANELGEGWTMHSLRHRFASICYSETQDLAAIQDLLGHASVKTTRRYIAVDARRLRAVASTARLAA